MTATAELDPYLLQMPSANTPVVLSEFVVPDHAHLNAHYTADIWPLAPLDANPGKRKDQIHWQNCPALFESELRLAAWTMINGRLRPTFLRDRGTRIRSRIATSTLKDTVTHWMALAAWLEPRGILTLADCDAAVLHEYGLHLLARGRSRTRQRQRLGSLTRLWAFDQLSACPSGIGQPPWDGLGIDDYLPRATSTGGENDREPLDEKTMGPLLVWAIRMVDDLADDILTAWGETQRLLHGARTNLPTTSGMASLHAFLDPLIASQAPLPTFFHRGRTSLARSYIRGMTGASRGQLAEFVTRNGLVSLARQRPGPCPLDVPVKGLIGGAPWKESLDFGETAGLMRQLGTACFIVIAYLTGMRPGEVLGLRSGCCPDPEPDADGNVGRHLIRSHEYKTATDEHGNYLSTGTERDVPWVAIAPVVNAIRVLERFVDAGQLLFSHEAHDLQGRKGTGALKPSGLRERIEDFITWANAEAATHELTGEVIPADPHGKVGTARFRRSLAWHIARRPGGLVALAIQYGHLRTAITSEGYASRSRDGIHELIDVETVRAVADTVSELHDDLEAGAGISGPAAQRAIRAAATAPRFEGTVITPTTARRLIANEDAMIFDNPQAFVLCHYKRAQALCHRDGVKDTPSLDHCVAGCGNIVRTDRHAVQLRDRAEILDTRAAAVPQPLGDRFRANADKLRAFADAHDRTKTTLLEASA
ncbi:integrase [Actinacidiphila alni]|uniref:integrase n=1 Tax=Actinacidiphila alni TaxID=380248 RepID=UPI0034548918